MGINRRHTVFTVLLVLSAIAADDPTPIAVIEFKNSLFDQFEISGTAAGYVTMPESEGVPTYLNTSTRSTFRVQPSGSPNTVDFSFNTDVSGTSMVSVTQRVGPLKRKFVTVNTPGTTQASFSKIMSLTPDTMTSQPATGTIAMNASPQVSSNFRLGRNLVHGLSLRIANQKINEKMPIARSSMDRDMRANLDKGAEKIQDVVQGLMKEVNALPSQEFSASYTPTLTGDGSPNGKIRWSLKPNGTTSAVPLPASSVEDQAATSMVINEEFLNRLMADQFGSKNKDAPKKQRVSEVFEKFCTSKVPPLRALCDPKLIKQFKPITVVFDPEKPLTVHFDKNQIRLNWNGIFEMDNPDDPSETPTVIQAGPFTMETSFAMEPTGMRLANLDIKESKASTTTTSEGANSNPLSFLFDGGKAKAHGDGDRPKSRTTPPNGFVNALAIDNIKKAIKPIMNSTVLDFKPISYPRNFQISNFLPGQDPKVVPVGYATLFPLEMVADKGWLKFTTQVCSDQSTVSKAFAPLGAAFDASMIVSQVSPGSPAALAGLEPGFRVTGFSSKTDGVTRIAYGAADFAQLLEQKSKGESAPDRMVTLVGFDRGGKAFEKTIALCPSNYPHEKKANELMNELSNMDLTPGPAVVVPPSIRPEAPPVAKPKPEPKVEEKPVEKPATPAVPAGVPSFAAPPSTAASLDGTFSISLPGGSAEDLKKAKAQGATHWDMATDGSRRVLFFKAR